MSETIFENPQEIRKGPHVFENGKYVKVDNFIPGEYPKAMYHADYVHNKKDGVEYGLTESAVTVNNRAEEEALGPEWKPSLIAHGIITAPDAEHLAKQKAEKSKAGANWRAALGAVPNEDLGQKHIDFLQANGMPEIKTLAELYNFAAKFTGQQMRSFLAEVAAWKPKKA